MNIKTEIGTLFTLSLLLIFGSCGGTDEVTPSCEEIFRGDTTTQEFILRLEEAIETGNCQEAQNTFEVLNLVAEPYLNCPAAVNTIDELESSYVAFLSNCSNDTIINSLTATVSGTINFDFEAVGSAVGESQVLVVQDSTTLTFLAYDVASLTTTNQITINLTNYIGSGTYSLSIAEGNTAVFSQVLVNVLSPSDTEVVPYAALSGLLEIVETDSTFSGSFQFSAINQNLQPVNVTEGVFYLQRN